MLKSGSLYILKRNTLFFEDNGDFMFLKKNKCVLYLKPEPHPGMLSKYAYEYHYFYSFEMNKILTTSQITGRNMKVVKKG